MDAFFVREVKEITVESLKSIDPSSHINITPVGFIIYDTTIFKKDAMPSNHESLSDFLGLDNIVDIKNSIPNIKLYCAICKHFDQFKNDLWQARDPRDWNFTKKDLESNGDEFIEVLKELCVLPQAYW